MLSEPSPKSAPLDWRLQGKEIRMMNRELPGDIDLCSQECHESVVERERESDERWEPYGVRTT